MRNVQTYEDFLEEGKGSKGLTGATESPAPAMTDDDAVEETVVVRATGGDKFDITTNAKSVAGRVEALIGQMGTMSFEAIKDQFLMILKDPSTHASEATRNKWLEIAAKARGKVDIMRSITNLYLKAANLGVEG